MPHDTRGRAACATSLYFLRRQGGGGDAGVARFGEWSGPLWAGHPVICSSLCAFDFLCDVVPRTCRTPRATAPSPEEVRHAHGIAAPVLLGYALNTGGTQPDRHPETATRPEGREKWARPTPGRRVGQLEPSGARVPSINPGDVDWPARPAGTTGPPTNPGVLGWPVRVSWNK